MHLRSIPILDRLCAISLILNATGLFRFIAPQLGVPIAYVTMVLIVFHGTYLFLRLGPFLKLLPHLTRWIVILAVWPLLTLVEAPAPDARVAGLTIYYTMLLCSAVVFVHCNGLRAMHRVFYWSLLLHVGGILLSMLAPGYFQGVANLVGTKESFMSMGRAFGFQMAPNKCAVALVLLTLGWFSMWKRQTILAEPILLVLFLGLLLFTGSRSAIAVGLAVVGLHIAYQARSRLAARPAARRFSARMAMLIFAAAVGLAIAPILLSHYATRVDRRPGDLIDRAEALLSFKFSPDGSIASDGSIQERLDLRDAWLTLIADRPFLGHGLGGEQYFVASGQVEKIAHSILLSFAFDYGWVYPVIYLLLISTLYVHPARKRIEAFFGTNTYTQFMAAFALFFLVTPAMVDLRLYYIFLGTLIACQVYPQRLFVINETGNIQDVRQRPGVDASTEGTRPS